MCAIGVSFSLSVLGGLPAIAHTLDTNVRNAPVRDEAASSMNTDWTSAAATADFDPGVDTGSMYNVAREVGAPSLWAQGYTGKGVDVALIDSGVVGVNGLTAPGKVIHGPDLSFDSQYESLRYLDTYGHGTHIASIIAGKDDGVSVPGAPDSFTGIAPDARILNVKVANSTGATDVTQVLAAIDWVVQHRRDNGMNVRVINLSFGTDSTQGYLDDPLAYAVEAAWRKGIVVVVAAGNYGETRTGLSDPAFDPYVLAVGADDAKGTESVLDDNIPSWSSAGDGVRNPDLVAPGRSIASLRNPGSFIDQNFPDARAGSRFFRGSGTSQAAAVISGAAALLLQQRPDLTPDQVKALLTSTSKPIASVPPTRQGAGFVDLTSASLAVTPLATQSWPVSSGMGSLEEARGTVHVLSAKGKVLKGPKDIFDSNFNTNKWAGASWSGASWSGGTWNGTTWSGASWSGASWSGASWSGASWSCAAWPGASWSGASWSGEGWSGASWSGASWSGASWSGASWSGASWSGASWSGASWSSSRWE